MEYNRFLVLSFVLVQNDITYLWHHCACVHNMVLLTFCSKSIDVLREKRLVIITLYIILLCVRELEKRVDRMPGTPSHELCVCVCVCVYVCMCVSV